MNRQTCYLIVGKVKTAKHTQYYFSLPAISLNTWNRSDSKSFSETVETAFKILGLFSNGTAKEFISEKKVFIDDLVTLIHFSCTLSKSIVESAYQLMVFGDSLYGLINRKEE